MNAAQRRKAYRKHPKAGDTVILRGIPRLVLGPCTFNSLTGEERSKPSVMPVAFEFKCVPYEGLGERRFNLRNSLLTSDEPCFVLRIVQLEAQEEEIANEFRDLLISKFEGESVETFIGNFKA